MSKVTVCSDETSPYSERTLNTDVRIEMEGRRKFDNYLVEIEALKGIKIYERPGVALIWEGTERSREDESDT
jgi:hypothetical protein